MLGANDMLGTQIGTDKCQLMQDNVNTLCSATG